MIIHRFFALKPICVQGAKQELEKRVDGVSIIRRIFVEKLMISKHSF
jgi:hypothetical protein